MWVYRGPSVWTFVHTSDTLRVLARVASFDWDSGNREKCTQHGLSLDEIEFVLRRREAEHLVRPISALHASERGSSL